MHYAISDIHGCYELFLKLLEQISFSDQDVLYFLGDAADRGPAGIEVIRDLMHRPNVVCLLGNHEDMFRQAARGYGKRKSLVQRAEYQRIFLNWTIRNGGEVTWEAWKRCKPEERQEILDWLESLPCWLELQINGRSFLLAHAGVGAYAPEKDPSACELHDFIWERMDYSKTYYQNKLLVTGHTPTYFIDPALEGKLYRKNNHIDIDCGAVYTGTLGCICLETLEPFYCTLDKRDEKLEN